MNDRTPREDGLYIAGQTGFEETGLAQHGSEHPEIDEKDVAVQDLLRTQRRILMQTENLWKAGKKTGNP